MDFEKNSEVFKAICNAFDPRIVKHGHQDKEILRNYNEEEFRMPPKRSDKQSNGLNITECDRLLKSRPSILQQMLIWVEHMQCTRFRGCTTIMAIPITSKFALENISKPSDVRKWMLAVGLISTCSDKYRFKSDSTICESIPTFSKTFYYYYDVEQQLKQYCAEHDVIAKCAKHYNLRAIGLDDLDVKVGFDPSKVIISNKLHGINFPVSTRDEDIRIITSSILNRNYPQMVEDQKKLAENNKAYKSSEAKQLLSQRMGWNIQIKTVKYINKMGKERAYKTVKSICTRATNDSCGAKKGDYESGREKILKQFNMTRAYDVKSSIPRVMASLTAGHWISEDIDLYGMIGQMLGLDNNYRDTLKSLTMRYMFANSYEMSILDHTPNYVIEKYGSDNAKSSLAMAKEMTKQVIGDYTYGTEAFLHESCIMIDVQQKLTRRGYLTWCVYDGIYSTSLGESQEEFEEMCRQLVEESANEYIAKYSYTAHPKIK